jgi:hypothetical protein
LSRSRSCDVEWRGGAPPNFYTWRVFTDLRGFGCATKPRLLVLPYPKPPQTYQSNHQENVASPFNTPRFSSMLKWYSMMLQSVSLLCYRYVVRHTHRTKLVLEIAQQGKSGIAGTCRVRGVLFFNGAVKTMAPLCFTILAITLGLPSFPVLCAEIGCESKELARARC